MLRPDSGHLLRACGSWVWRPPGVSLDANPDDRSGNFSARKLPRRLRIAKRPLVNAGTSSESTRGPSSVCPPRHWPVTQARRGAGREVLVVLKRVSAAECGGGSGCHALFVTESIGGVRDSKALTVAGLKSLPCRREILFAACFPRAILRVRGNRSSPVNHPGGSRCFSIRTC